MCSPSRGAGAAALGSMSEKRIAWRLAGCVPSTGCSTVLEVAAVRELRIVVQVAEVRRPRPRRRPRPAGASASVERASACASTRRAGARASSTCARRPAVVASAGSTAHAGRAERLDQALPVGVVVDGDRDPAIAPSSPAQRKTPCGAACRERLPIAAEDFAVRGEGERCTRRDRRCRLRPATGRCAGPRRSAPRCSSAAASSSAAKRGESESVIVPYGPIGSRSGQPVRWLKPDERRALAAEAGVGRSRAGLAVQAGADHDQVGAFLHQRRVVEPPLRHRAGREVLGDRSRPSASRRATRDARGRRQVERDRELVGVEHGEVLAAVELPGVSGVSPACAGSRGAGATRRGSRWRRGRRSSASATGPAAPPPNSRIFVPREERRSRDHARRARSRASAAALTPSSASTSAVCSPSRGAGPRTPIAVAVRVPATSCARTVPGSEAARGPDARRRRRTRAPRAARRRRSRARCWPAPASGCARRRPRRAPASSCVRKNAAELARQRVDLVLRQQVVVVGLPVHRA